MGYVNPTTGSINITNIRDVPGANPSETDTKSFATDGQGGVYVVSDYALYRFQVGSNGAPRTLGARLTIAELARSPGRIR